jgi:hypothetical protein
VDTESSKANIFSEWDRMNTIWFRYWRNFEEKGKAIDLKEVERHEEHCASFKREVQFLVKSTCDLEFHQYLNKRTDYTKEKGRKDGVVMRKHLKELVRYVFLDKLRQRAGKFATTQDLSSPKRYSQTGPLTDGRGKQMPREDSNNTLSYAQLHRMINEYYPELLTTRIELRGRLGRRKYSNGRKINDHRERILETQFTLKEKVPSGIFDLVVIRAMKEDATPEFLKRARFQAKINSKLMMCDPIDLAKLVAFREDVLEIIEDLGVNPFMDDEVDGDMVKFAESSLFNLLVESLFFQLRALEELRWFREKSEHIQKSIIFREPQLPKYTRRNAARAVNLSLQWHRNPETVLHLMDIIGFLSSQYLRKVFPKMGLWLSEECMLQLDLSDEWKANACYNIGMGYFENGQSRLMLKWLKKSLSIDERIGDHRGDMADACGYIAEYWRSRNTSKYLFFRNKAEELVKSNILSPRRKAFHYLFLSNCALMNKDKPWEKHLYELGLVLSGKHPSLQDFANFFNQCLNDLEEFGERLLDIGHGRYPPPQDWVEMKISPSLGMIIADPDFGN